MKKIFRMIITAAMPLCMIFPAFAADAYPQKKDPSTAILFTNDVHCNYDQNIGYDGLMLYKKELEQKYEHVILVDAGDAIQGAPIGAISNGKEIIRIMNEVGYDIAILGNHEFDYGFYVLDDLGEQLKCSYICANFCTQDGEPVFEPYRIVDCGDMQIAFIGADTPESFSKTGIRELIDDQGVPLYDFKSDVSGEPLYSCLQKYIDEVKEKGADVTILAGHLGNAESTEKTFRSNEVVARLTGLDAVIDGHSHEVYNTAVKDLNGKEIPIVQTGCNFQNVGTMIIHPDDTIETELLDEIPAPEEWMEGIEASCVTRNGKDRFVDAGMHQFLEDITASYADEMNRKVGEVSFEMDVRNEEEGDISQCRENALCDLVADAYRTAAGTDISFINAGSVRNNLPAGEITFNTVMNVLPYSNDIVIAEMKGQTILDALELGCMNLPTGTAGFPQVSGMEFTVDPGIESTVETTEKGDFIKVAGTRRVSDVLIDGKTLDPEAVYTVASTEFLLKGGDHYAMFTESAEITGTTNLTDNALLAQYIENDLQGVIPETYMQPGGRIHIK